MVVSLTDLSSTGPGYSTSDVFDLSSMLPYNLATLHGALRDLTPSVALYLPRTSDLRQLANRDNDKRKIAVVHYCMEGASKVCKITTHS